MNSDQSKHNRKLYYRNYYQRNKEHKREYYRKYRKLNKDKIKRTNQKYYKEYYKNYYDKNKENIMRKRMVHPFKKLTRASNSRYKNDKITSFDLFKIAKRQKLKCALTGEKLTNKNISLDHIKPKSKGGLNILSNIRLVLHPVNIARQNMTDEEFITMCKKVSDHSKKYE